jgi:hypothetical protein
MVRILRVATTRSFTGKSRGFFEIGLVELLVQCGTPIFVPTINDVLAAIFASVDFSFTNRRSTYADYQSVLDYDQTAFSSSGAVETKLPPTSRSQATSMGRPLNASTWLTHINSTHICQLKTGLGRKTHDVAFPEQEARQKSRKSR